ncbi:hypothetical protein Tco_1181627 [Tanacetum coccineum]
MSNRHQELASPKQTTLGKDKSNPFMVDSLPKTIWLSMHHVLAIKHWLVQSKRLLETAILSTTEEGLQAISATIDGHEKLITEDSLRRHLKLEDAEGISSLSNEEIFEHLAHMGYVTNSESLTFFKGHFLPQWKFFIHTILHCLSSKKTAWDQISSNIATAIICLATSRRFNFSKFIFEAMVKNLDSPHKFLLYPRVVTPLFKSMLVQAHDEEQQQSPSRITSSPSLSQQPTQSSSSPELVQPTHEADETASMPHDSPLHA